MKRKNLILLENRLRKLLKENTIKDPKDNKEVEVAPGVQLPPKGPMGEHFDFVLDLGGGSTISYNRKVRQPNASSGDEYNKWTASTYGGVVRYKNTEGVVMYFYAKPDPDDAQKPDLNGLMGNTKDTDLDDNFKNQDQWNNYVKKIEDRKAGKSSVGVSGVDRNTTTKIQQYIMNNFPDYKQYMGKKPDDGYWGVKTDEAILRIIFDLENKKGTQADISQTKVGSKVGSEIGKAQSKPSGLNQKI